MICNGHDDDYDDVDDESRYSYQSIIASRSVTRASRTGDPRATASSSVDMITSASAAALVPLSTTVSSSSQR